MLELNQTTEVVNPLGSSEEFGCQVERNDQDDEGNFLEKKLLHHNNLW